MRHTWRLLLTGSPLMMDGTAVDHRFPGRNSFLLATVDSRRCDASFWCSSTCRMRTEQVRVREPKSEILLNVAQIIVFTSCYLSRVVSRQDMSQQIRAQAKNFSAFEEKVEKDRSDVWSINRATNDKQGCVVQPDTVAGLLSCYRINGVGVLLQDGSKGFDDVVSGSNAVRINQNIWRLCSNQFLLLATDRMWRLWWLQFRWLLSQCLLRFGRCNWW